MSEFGLIGKKLGHSFSKRYFEDKFQTLNLDHVYNLYELENINDVLHIIRNPKVKGLNITIPYKTEILDHIDYLSDEVKMISASNVLKRNQDQSWTAYNTDVYGFEKSLDSFIPKTKFNALVLGTGGASKAVQYVLNEKQISCKLVSRHPMTEDQIHYDEISASIMEESKLIINATPLGMSPNQDSFPNIPYNHLTSSHYLFDLVYNPSETAFLNKGKAQGSYVKNGLEMLHLQAEKAWSIWNSSE